MLPLPVFDFSNHANIGVIGGCSQLPQKLREEPGALHDDLLEVAGEFPRQGEQDILVLASYLGEFTITSSDGGGKTPLSILES